LSDVSYIGPLACDDKPLEPTIGFADVALSNAWCVKHSHRCEKMTAEEPPLHLETLAAQGMGRVAAPFREIVPPIHMATTYERGIDGDYPMFQALAPGDCVLAPRNMYWALRNWLVQVAAPWGLAVDFYANTSLDDLAEKTRTRRPRLIWIETPANPTWEITDIAAASEIARAVGAVVAVDSTAATPMLTRPIELGAHIVMHSATKYLNGHSDAIAGALATAHEDALWQRIRYLRSASGAVLGPFESWLLLRGMRTLHLRVAAACANAQAIAERLHGHAKLSHVLYPGLATSPGHEVAARQMRGGFGGMMSLRLKDGEAAAKSFAARLEVFKRATSLGSVESLAEHRASVEGPGTLCPVDLVRLSIGIEHGDDLIADIGQALA